MMPFLQDKTLCFPQLIFSSLMNIFSETILCSVMKFGIVINNIIVHDPVEQIILYRPIIVKRSKYVNIIYCSYIFFFI